ncbi:GNAT family N-acetyltransferase [Kribbella shirazensis]|uniref:Putative acetyltransferase n=1 Tax=Kribbella shirazensis TaxID=1105143 RepID=A0A7X5VJ69_9ACTN|nr:GNAT family N-acetyltransferase [Kribbella shirazensis]NIK62203.1 putative acetyltransferase [Kribbella shirazensis]
MAIEIGKFTGTWEELLELLDMAFSSPWSDEQYEVERQIWDQDRSIVASEDGQLVGHTAAFPQLLTVPGGQLPTAGVTMVGVRPTHRRRGILRDLMRTQLTDIHEAGQEPLAALTASEPVIYPRFGYGLASDHQEIVVPKASRALRPVAGIDEVRIRYVDVHESLERCAELRNKLALETPGMFQHDERWQQYTIRDNLTTSTTNASKLRCVVAERDGELTGFAHYRTKRAEKGYVDVQRVHAVDVASHAALWRYLLEPDLLSQTHCEMLASDDPLLDLLLDPRAPGAITRDGLWLRLVDVGRALASRTYARDIDVVIEVIDDFLPWSAGRWHLTGGPDGAACESVTRDADLTLDVRDLGAVYLGKPSLERLGRAGLVAEHKPGALSATSEALSTSRLPFLDTGF